MCAIKSFLRRIRLWINIIIDLNSFLNRLLTHIIWVDGNNDQTLFSIFGIDPFEIREWRSRWCNKSAIGAQQRPQSHRTLAQRSPSFYIVGSGRKLLPQWLQVDTRYIMADLDMIQTHVDNIRYLLHRWGGGGQPKSTISTFYALGKIRRKRHDGFIRHNKKKRWRQVRFLAPFIWSDPFRRWRERVWTIHAKLLYVGLEIPAVLNVSTGPKRNKKGRMRETARKSPRTINSNSPASASRREYQLVKIKEELTRKSD